MHDKSVSKRVLDESYALGRAKRPEFIFRYKSRALIAHWAVQKYGTQQGPQVIVDYGCAEGLTLVYPNLLLLPALLMTTSILYCHFGPISTQIILLFI